LSSPSGCVDNVYVEGSSTPISRTDESGDTCQVLKNFPAESELRAAVHDMALEVRVEFIRYYWTLSYRPKVDG
jgi:demethylmenaquinone methyltransferase/2-methoxy-6-polyprenyl-1,4-benzoquinol methylase